MLADLEPAEVTLGQRFSILYVNQTSAFCKRLSSAAFEPHALTG